MPVAQNVTQERLSLIMRIVANTVNFFFDLITWYPPRSSPRELQVEITACERELIFTGDLYSVILTLRYQQLRKHGLRKT